MNDDSVLQALMLDDHWPSCLKEWLNCVNILDVLRVSRTEIRHSNILAWLLNPKESHGLGTAFLDRFIKVICQKDKTKKSIFLFTNWDKAIVHREWGDTNARLDILIECKISASKTLVIALENKIDAKDKPRQLDKYCKEVKSAFSVKYNKGRFLFVFLTPNGDDPENAKDSDELWIRLSYTEIATIINDVLSLENLMPRNLKVLICDYEALIRRDIMINSELEKQCNTIYRKHKEAFDLVFKYADMNGALGEARSEIKKVLKQMCENSSGDLIFKGEDKGTQSVLSFHSKSMDECLGTHPNNVMGSWMNNSVYYYWIDINRYNGSIRLIVEFGPKNVAGSLLESMRKIGNIINPKKSLQDGVYRRLVSYKVGSVDDEFDSKIITAKVKKAIEKLQKDERMWLSKLGNKADAEG